MSVTGPEAGRGGPPGSGARRSRRLAIGRVAMSLPLLALWLLPEESWPAGLGGAVRWIEAWLPVLAYAGLAWGFGRTLRPGREPLIARYVRFDGRSDPAACAGYARGLTVFWTAAMAMAAVAEAVAAVAGFGLGWTVDAAMLALFLGEHLVRSLRFPADGPATPVRTLRAILRAELAQHG